MQLGYPEAQRIIICQQSLSASPPGGNAACSKIFVTTVRVSLHPRVYASEGTLPRVVLADVDTIKGNRKRGEQFRMTNNRTAEGDRSSYHRCQVAKAFQEKQSCIIHGSVSNFRGLADPNPDPVYLIFAPQFLCGPITKCGDFSIS